MAKPELEFKAVSFINILKTEWGVKRSGKENGERRGRPFYLDIYIKHLL
jgi:hypothetical protein